MQKNLDSAGQLGKGGCKTGHAAASASGVEGGGSCLQLRVQVFARFCVNLFVLPYPCW